jgi:hypothetical protein
VAVSGSTTLPLPFFKAAYFLAAAAIAAYFLSSAAFSNFA